MAVIAAHPPGAFCWPELATTDAQAAARFYSAVFDWSIQTPDSGDHQYLIFHIEGQNVGATYTLPEADVNRSPRWHAYVAVERVDDVARRARELGGKIVTAPADVGNAGRYAGLLDPTGAIVHVWEAKDQIGAHRINDPGYLSWTELIANDINAAETFYTKLFGWSAKRHRFGEYVEFLREGELAAGMLPTPPGRGAEGSHWLPYFAVSNVDDAVQVARRHFGKLLGRPMDIPMVGRSAVLRDPQGATFGIFGVNEAA